MNLLSTLTLGTARQALSPEAEAYLKLRDAVDPTADDAEKALAAYALTERLERLQFTKVAAPPSPQAIVESRALPRPKLSRALSLLFDDTYAAILPEAIRVLDGRELLFPPELLPGLLDFAAERQLEEPDLCDQALRVSGNRGKWLAGLNPAWKALAEDFNYPEAYRMEVRPANKRDILSKWRAIDPAAARQQLAEKWSGQSPKNQEMLVQALRVNLSDADLPWLREQLNPKRKGVRRAVFSLLLIGQEEQAINDLIRIAAAGLKDDGKFRANLQDAEARETLMEYGGLKVREDLGMFLLSLAPPSLLPDLLGLPLEEFWNTLAKTELIASASALINYQDSAAGAGFLRYALIARREKLPLTQLGMIAATLNQAAFEEVFHDFMDSEQDGFRSGSIAPLMAVMRREPWSERISKAFVLSLVGRIRNSYDLPYSSVREQAELWKRACNLLHVQSFPFLKQHLHSVTERPDQFGQLSLSLLQSVAFRRVLVQ